MVYGPEVNLHMTQAYSTESYHSPIFVAWRPLPRPRPLATTLACPTLGAVRVPTSDSAPSSPGGLDG